MKSFSIHYVLTGNSDYVNLAPVFPDILKEILADNGHFQDEEGKETIEMYTALNTFDLEQNRKPEGYNRKGKYRLIFPIDRKEFYIITYDDKARGEIKRIENKITEILSTIGDLHYNSFSNQIGYGISGYGTPGLLTGVEEIGAFKQIYLKNNEIRNELEGTFIRVDAGCNVKVPPKGEVIIDGHLYKNTSEVDSLSLFINTNSPDAKNVNLMKGSVEIEKGVVVIINEKPTNGKETLFAK
ncbi:MAG: hypothetical protein MJY64_02805 [archaeon]|nr:hypothetical protein [archaeon]